MFYIQFVRCVCFCYCDFILYLYSDFFGLFYKFVAKIVKKVLKNNCRVTECLNFLRTVLYLSVYRGLALFNLWLNIGFALG